jgi:lipopolysaccharide assembly outer membrane protein LptD (OstA)
MLEGEFRYLLPYGGTGSLQGSFLPSDSLYADRDRKSIAWQHSGQLSSLSVSVPM